MTSFSWSFALSQSEYNRDMNYVRILLCLAFLSGTMAAQPQIISKDDVELKKDIPVATDYATYSDLKGLDSFYDPRIDYSKFSGRLSDKDLNSTIFKIQVESKNIKFFKASDSLFFRVAHRRDREPCHANIRSVEDGFITIFVKSLYECWGKSKTFRRGTIMIFESDKLAKRIRDASLYRVSLMAKKKDYLYQLNKVNRFVWGFRQEQVNLAAEYDRKILEMQKQKEKALDLLLAKKRDNMRIQKELAYRLDELDDDLKYYRVEKDELFTDRWHLDQEAGIPVYTKPHGLKAK